MSKKKREPEAKAKRNAPDLVDLRLIAALSHTTRAHALNILTQRPTSAKELALEVDETISNVFYHLEKLLKLGCIEEVGSAKRRGATERFYKATVEHFFDAPAWEGVPKKDRLYITMGVLRLISSDLRESLIAGTADADDRHLSRTVMDLDDQGWKEVGKLLETTLEELLSIRARTAKRLAKTGAASKVTKVSIMQLETPNST